MFPNPGADVNGKKMFKKAERHANAIFFGKDLEKAYDCYMAAIPYYKGQQDFDRVGECLERAGDVAKRSGDIEKANTAYIWAAGKYSLSNMDRAMGVLHRALRMNAKRGRIVDVIRFHREIAERYAENGQKREAVINYVLAHDLFKTLRANAGDKTDIPGGNGRAQEADDMQYQIITAKLLGDVGDYREAGEHYEELGMMQLTEQMKHHANEYFLRATLSLTAAAVTALGQGITEGEVVRPVAKLFKIKVAVEKHQHTDPKFSELPTTPILLKLIDAALNLINEANQKEEERGTTPLGRLTEVVNEMVELGLMDGWKTRALEAITHPKAKAEGIKE